MAQPPLLFSEVCGYLWVASREEANGKHGPKCHLVPATEGEHVHVLVGQGYRCACSFQVHSCKVVEQACVSHPAWPVLMLSMLTLYPRYGRRESNPQWT